MEDRHHWLRVRELFDSVFDLDPVSRSAALIAHCGDDAELRDRVASMVAHLEAAPDFLEPQDATIPELLEQLGRDELAPGDEFGDFRIIRKLGSGAQGVVYEALGVAPSRRVALKVYHPDALPVEARSRLDRESEIQGSLEHPFIARVYAAIRVPRPEGLRRAIVMEKVDGKPLTEFARDAELSLDARVALLASICDAVEVASRKLIVHLDLKPSNILVDESGIPHILDFGIARALEGVHASLNTEPGLGRLAGTLPYMSPEQARGQEVDPRADVYALGIILYELCTGEWPWDLQNLPHFESIRRISEVSPKPMRRCYDGHGSVPKALRTIFEAAINCNLKHRYTWPGDVAAELRRYLNREPLAVAAPGLILRARLFAARNRTPVRAAAAIFLLLLTGVLATGWQAWRATSAEARSEAQQREIRSIARVMMTDVLDAVDDVPQGLEASMLISETALTYLEGLLKTDPHAPELTRDVAEGLRRLARVTGSAGSSSYGNTPRALEIYDRSIALGEAILAAAPRDVDLRRLLRALYFERGFSRLSESIARADEGIADYRRALDLALGLMSEGTLDDVNRLSQVAHQLVGALVDSGDSGQATRVRARVAAEIKSRVPAQATADSVSMYARALSGVALMHLRLGEYEDARAVYSDVLSFYEHAFALGLSERFYMQQRGNTFRYRALAWYESGLFHNAERDQSEALRHLKWLLNTGPRERPIAHACGLVLAERAATHIMQRDLAAARSDVADLRDVLDTLLAEDPTNGWMARSQIRLHEKVDTAIARALGLPETPPEHAAELARFAIELREANLASLGAGYAATLPQDEIARRRQVQADAIARYSPLIGSQNTGEVDGRDDPDDADEVDVVEVADP